MNAKMKFAMAAVAMAIGGTANAEIDRFDTGNGELFFSVRDNVQQISYVLDLNITMNDFIEGDLTPYSFSADANLGSFLSGWSGNNADLDWAVMAGDSMAGGATLFDPILTDTQRVLTTSASGLTQVSTTTRANLVGAVGLDTSYVVNVNFSPNFDGLSGVMSSGDADYFDAAFDTWAGNVPFSATAKAGEEMNFYFLERTTTEPGVADVSAFLSTWSFNAETATLTYGAAAVPVPAAIWLLGSALVGLVGVSRRKQQLTAA